MKEAFALEVRSGNKQECPITYAQKGKISMSVPPGGPVSKSAWLAALAILKYQSSSDMIWCPYATQMMMAVENL